MTGEQTDKGLKVEEGDAIANSVTSYGVFVKETEFMKDQEEFIGNVDNTNEQLTKESTVEKLTTKEEILLSDFETEDASLEADLVNFDSFSMTKNIDSPKDDEYQSKATGDENEKDTQMIHEENFVEEFENLPNDLFDNGEAEQSKELKINQFDLRPITESIIKNTEEETELIDLVDLDIAEQQSVTKDSAEKEETEKIGGLDFSEFIEESEEYQSEKNTKVLESVEGTGDFGLLDDNVIETISINEFPDLAYSQKHQELALNLLEAETPATNIKKELESIKDELNELRQELYNLKKGRVFSKDKSVDKNESSIPLGDMDSNVFFPTESTEVAALTNKTKPSETDILSMENDESYKSIENLHESDSASFKDKNKLNPSEIEINTLASVEEDKDITLTDDELDNILNSSDHVEVIESEYPTIEEFEDNMNVGSPNIHEAEYIEDTNDSDSHSTLENITEIAGPDNDTVEEVNLPEIQNNPRSEEVKPSSANFKLRKELKDVLSYMDTLLESLPEEKIEEFAQSKHFDNYQNLFKELGL